MAEGKRPWLKFFPQDWAGDRKLRFCSIAARGMWIEMMCIAHEARPYGYVLVNGEVPSLSQLARLCGVSEAEAKTLISELDRTGVISRRRDQTIYSRRMVRDEKKAQIARQNGINGGASKHKKRKRNSGVGKQNGTDPPTDPPKPQRPEARGQKESKKVGGASRADKKFVWQGRVIRLTEPDYSRWRQAYSAIPDFNAALQAADDYYSENPPKDGKWFFPVSNWLKRDQQQFMAEKQKANGSGYKSMGYPDAYYKAHKLWVLGGEEGEPPRPEDFE